MIGSFRGGRGVSYYGYYGGPPPVSTQATSAPALSSSRTISVRGGEWLVGKKVGAWAEAVDVLMWGGMVGGGGGAIAARAARAVHPIPFSPPAKCAPTLRTISVTAWWRRGVV